MKIEMRLSDGTVLEAYPESKKDVKQLYRTIQAGGLLTLYPGDGTEVTVNTQFVVYAREEP